MPTNIIYLLFIFILSNVFEQDAYGKITTIDTASINNLLKIADKLEPDRAILMFNEVLQQSIKADYADGAFKAIITISIKYHEKEDYEQSNIYCHYALLWAAKSHLKDAVAWCYNNIGDNYLSEGDYIKASENFYKALSELQKIPPEPNHTSANIYNNLGTVNLRLNQPDKALAYYNLAEEVAEEGKLWYQLADADNSKGEFYLQFHQADSAKKYFSQELEIGKTINKDDLQALAYLELGKTNIEIRAHKIAIANLKKAVQLTMGRFNDVVIDASFALGDAYYHLKKSKEAETILLSALNEMKAHNMKDRYIKGYTKIIEFYKATGQYKVAQGYIDTLNNLKDSLTNLEKTKAVNMMEIKYKTAEKDKVIAQNQLVIAHQQNKIVQKNMWFWGIIGIVILLSLIMTGLYYRTEQKQKLQHEQIKILQGENTISILKGVVQGEEKERTRIARELHDGIGGMLSVAMLSFSSLKHENEVITNLSPYQQGMNILNDMGEEIRKTAHNLMPDILEKQDLQEAVFNYCNAVSEGGNLRIDFQSIGDFAQLEKDVKLNIYRIVQELIKNVMQHAGATTVIVQLLMHDNLLSVTVEEMARGLMPRSNKPAWDYKTCKHGYKA